jgi:FAD dependent oxidoreductase
MLFAAARRIPARRLSAEHEAMAPACVTAPNFSNGQSIGNATSLAVRKEVAPRRLDGTEVREAPSRNGAGLDAAVPHGGLVHGKACKKQRVRVALDIRVVY